MTKVDAKELGSAVAFHVLYNGIDNRNSICNFDVRSPLFYMWNAAPNICPCN